MTLFIQNDATGAGAGTINANQAALDVGIIANGDTGVGLAGAVGNRQQVTYARTDPGIPPVRLDALVNTNFNPDYGQGAGQQAVPIVILAVGSNFVFNDGATIVTVGGRALPPSNSALPGATLNNTTDCLAIYDTSQANGAGWCLARAGTGGTLDLQTPNPVILYHELSHCFRIGNNNLNALRAGCNPSSPEENAAIVDENDLRNQIAAATGQPAVLRDPGIHCGDTCAGGSTTNCCIIASVASGSPLSAEVAELRRVRDGLLRKTEVGFAFFDALHRDYYAFSPQVSTLLARDPTLRPLVMEGLVRPLVCILRTIEAFALGGADAAEVGEWFVSEHRDRESGLARLTILERARSLLGAQDVQLTENERELADLASPALRSEHLLWAVVEPVQLYEEVLAAYLDGASVEAIGDRLQVGIEAWAARVPLDSVWASLSAAELQAELGFLEGTLLRSKEARAQFRGRLRQQHGRATAVDGISDDEEAQG